MKKTPTVEYRDATAADLIDFYGELPAQTIRAVAITMGGKTQAVIGMARFEDHYRYFSDYKPELAPHLKSITVLRAIKKSITIVATSRLPVLAIADNPPLLARLGFISGDDNNEVFVWPDWWP